MKIAVIGANGKSGRWIVKEALQRGHQVTGIVRNAARLSDLSIPVQEKDLFDLKHEDLIGFDVVVNAFNAAPGQEHQHIEAGKVLIAALAGSPTRLVVVGGAGSLFVDEEKKVRLFDTPDFPAAYLPTAKNMGDNLLQLEASENVNWTFLSPAAFFDPDGKRTGSYTLGKDNVILNSKGQSYVSYADFAIALVDEIEKTAHLKQRFTVVSEQEG